MKRQVGRDALNQPIEDWADVATVYADVRFQSGAEVLRANAEVSVKRASIRIRGRKDIDASWRIRYQGEEFDVKSALPDDDRSFVFLVCESVK
jgi:SPP1 family predicted phage head-tail adaptor